MKKLALIVFILLIVLSAQADSEKIRIKVKDANGDSKTIEGNLIEVDFTGWRMHIEISPTKIIWINFTDIQSSIYKYLVDLADTPEKLYESAKFMLFINRLDSSEKLMEKAEKAGFSDETKIKEFYSQYYEFLGQQIIKEIQEKIASGDFNQASKLLNDLKDKKFLSTQAYLQIDKLSNQLERAQLNTDDNSSRNFKDIEKEFEEGIILYELALSRGHQSYFDDKGGFNCKKIWDKLIDELDSKNRSSLLVRLKAYEKQQPEGILRDKIKAMSEKTSDILVCAYKNIINFLLIANSFVEVYDYLRKALLIAPLDRELLYYWYLYDEYRPLVTTVPKADDDKDEEER